MRVDRGIAARFAVWLAALAALGYAYAAHVHGRMRVETDLLAMLPQVERDALVDHAVLALAATTGKRCLFLVGAPDEPRARAAAADLAQLLEKSGAFGNVTLNVALDSRELDALYAPHRGALLSDEHRALLASGQSARLSMDAQRALYSPAGWLRARPFAQDPLNLYGDFLASQLPRTGNLHLSSGVLVAASSRGPYVLVTAESQADPFTLSDNARVEGAIKAVITEVQGKHEGAEVLASGVVRHAAAASERGQSEFTLFGTISTLAIVLLVASVFRSGRPLLLTLVSLGTGTLAALTACSLLFERVHLITLVFGSTLTGVSVDYSIHYFSDQFRHQGRWDPRDTLRHVGPAIGIGMLATLLGYGALLLLPFPGLRQMATFSIVGVLAAGLTVLMAHPFLANRAPASHRPRALRLAGALADLPLSGRLRAPSIAFVAVLVGLCAFGSWRLQFVDDIRGLQSTPGWLKDTELRVRDLLGGGFDTRFFLVEGATPEMLLQNEETLREGLNALIARGELSGYQAVSRALPSLAHQQQNARWLSEKVHSPDGELSKLLSRVGYAPKQIRSRLATFRGAEKPLTPEQWLASPVSAPLRNLWLADTSQALGRGYASAVSLSGVKDPATLQALDERIPHAQFVDRVARVSDVLRRFRQLASIGLISAFAVIGVVLILRYDLATGLRLMIAPVGGAALTLATLGFLGVNANLFNVLALLLVLGMGVDYAVFMREGRDARTTVIMAILLAGLMTLLSFGLLALSSTPFLRSLGLTVMLGVSFTFLLALLSTSGENAHPAPDGKTS